MEKELNIAAILKDKPRDTSLYSPIFGLCGLDEVNMKWKEFPISIIYESQIKHFRKDGRFFFTGECMLFPSKQMRDWEKFAWKKGDVLCSKAGDSCIFVKWISADYTSFLGYYSTHKNYENEECQTAIWSKIANKEDIEQYILAIEAVKNGTLNLETLAIEQPKQEFKDGDILVVTCTTHSVIAIFKNLQMEHLDCYAYLSSELHVEDWLNIGEKELRPATDSEKQQLFDALAKEGKVWNPDTLQIEDLPKKCEFKAFDKVLIKDHNNDRWEIDFFAYYDEANQSYITTSGNSWNFCLPYNDSTKHLLGTTDEWKGGEG